MKWKKDTFDENAKMSIHIFYFIKICVYAFFICELRKSIQKLAFSVHI